LNKTILNFFVENINQKYRNNTYHNFQHGFSTAHFCFIAIFRCKKIEKCLRSIDVYAMLVAALMHDVDHPGNAALLEKVPLEILSPRQAYASSGRAEVYRDWVRRMKADRRTFLESYAVDPAIVEATNGA
jgi:hypothetical protein